MKTMYKTQSHKSTNEVNTMSLISVSDNTNGGYIILKSNKEKEKHENKQHNKVISKLSISLLATKHIK